MLWGLNRAERLPCLFPGVVSGYCDACEREVTVEGGYCCWIGGREITVRVIIECAMSGYCGF